MRINSFWLNIIVIILILVASGIGYYYGKNKTNNDQTTTSGTTKVIQKVIDEIEPPTEVSNTEKIELNSFTNENHNITLNYPKDWQEKDLGGDKNVTEPLFRENIAYFYLPGTETDKKEPGTAIASVKLLKFVLEDTQINSADDWYNYIKEKVDDYQNGQSSQNYKLESMDKSNELDGKWTVLENYVENELIQGKDYYIYDNGQLYQFVAKAPKSYFDKYLPYIETIVKSIKFE